ncbi:HlyD family secretion protein [Pseudoroseicyclus aestuarii]|uniref:Multidrug resistance efflux pump n=1 Tax=Pseudoroseicyclus aestuarii TaxID=1795041 RepID=A0A318SWV4_9RHOB|nr:HlyD family secretion protein [Pseudoroseicyclus aestuarii]PYE84879.1 multidrug resistance efflux pump [Pseudoroseicyclus aestuarii]
MKKHIPALAAVILGLIGIAATLLAFGLPPFTSSVETTTNAYVRGHVVTLSPQVAGHVTEVTVRDFQRVEAGEVLARIDDRSLRQQLAQAQSQLDAARAAQENADQSQASGEAALRARQAALTSAQAALQTAQTSADRATELQGRGIVSTSSLDQSQLALDQANAGVAQAQSQLEVAEQDLKSVGSNRESLAAQVQAAEAAVELARIALDNATIRAPQAGQLGQVGVQAGQYVTPGSSLMALVPHDVWVVANYKETQLHGMQPGQRVTFSVDAMDGQVFTGHISGFSPATASEFSALGSSASGNFTKIAQRLPVRIAIDPGQPEAEALAPGLSVVVHTDTAQAPDPDWQPAPQPVTEETLAEAGPEPEAD